MSTLKRCRRPLFFCIRRILGHARRPFFLFGAGLLLLGLLSLHSTADPRHYIKSVAEVSVREVMGLHPARESVADHKQPLKESDLDVSTIDNMEKRLRDMQRQMNLGNFRITATSPNTSSNFRYRDLAATQAQRREHIRHVCQAKQEQASRGGKPLPGEPRYHEGWYGRTFLYQTLEVYEAQNFLFCPVLKVGSTFFRRLFHALGQGKAIKSPYDISIAVALGKRAAKSPSAWFKPAHPDAKKQAALPPPHPPHGTPSSIVKKPSLSASPQSAHLRGGGAGPRRSLKSFLGDLDARAPPDQRENHTALEDHKVEDFLDHAGKLMFTRDPYSKLLSGYVDKLFAPNPWFWNLVGKKIIKKYRPNASNASLRCGHDVTFQEFVLHVVDNERNNSAWRDAHFVPSYDQCKPCDIRYDIVGKMETFPADISLVAAQLGHNLSRSTLQAWNRESEADAIFDSISSAYKYWRKSIVKCMSWEEANRRIWRKLQMRGLVDRSQGLPSEDFPQYSKTASGFIAKAKLHWQQFRLNKPGSESSRQKKDALSSAYSLIPREHLDLIREYFSLDFDLFQYDPRPDSVFKAKRTWDVFTLQTTETERKPV